MKKGNAATFTLRIPRGLKDKAEQLATRDHMSINTWLLQIIERAARSQKATAQGAGHTKDRL